MVDDFLDTLYKTILSIFYRLWFFNFFITILKKKLTVLKYSHSIQKGKQMQKIWQLKHQKIYLCTVPTMIQQNNFQNTYEKDEATSNLYVKSEYMFYNSYNDLKIEATE